MRKSEATDDASTQSIPPTGDSFAACGIAGIAVLALGAALVMRKKEKNNTL